MSVPQKVNRLYPAHMTGARRTTIAIRQRDYIVDETGRAVPWPASYLELRDLVTRTHWMLFCPVVPWPESVVAAGDTLLWSNKARRFVGARVRTGRRSHHVAQSSNWPGLFEDPAAGLRALRSLFSACRAGDHPTPAALGQATMRRAFTGSRVQRPPLACVRDLRRGMIGGRSELFRPGAWGIAHEDDINAAYVAALHDVPTGPAHWRRTDPMFAGYAWWFGRYAWINQNEDCIIPILGLRREDGAVTYPRQTGRQFVGWYTKEEVFTALFHGYKMSWIDGWAWNTTTDAFEAWRAQIAAVRDNHVGLVRDWAKLVSVAAIGRFGVEPARYIVRFPGAPRTTAKRELITECKTGKVLFAIDREPNTTNPELLPHIAAKVHADVRMRTFNRALPLARERRLIGMNFDAVYYTGEPNANLGDEMGQWKHKQIVDATFPARRWLISRDEEKTPGMARSTR